MYPTILLYEIDLTFAAVMMGWYDLAPRSIASGQEAGTAFGNY